MNDYDPYDILEHDEVRKHLDLVMTNLSKKKESAIDTIGSKVAGILFWKLVGGIGFWDALECCSQKYLTKKLRAFQKEQLQHLKMHQNDLISEVGHSLVISVLTWAGIARFSGSNECIRMLWKIPWKILSTFSFTDGLEQYWDEDDERRIKLLWAALRNPICLLMNQLYRNHDVGNSEQINYLVQVADVEQQGGIANGLFYANAADIYGTTRQVIAQCGTSHYPIHLRTTEP